MSRRLVALAAGLVALSVVVLVALSIHRGRLASPPPAPAPASAAKLAPKAPKAPSVSSVSSAAAPSAGSKVKISEGAPMVIGSLGRGTGSGGGGVSGGKGLSGEMRGAAIGHMFGSAGKSSFGSAVGDAAGTGGLGMRGAGSGAEGSMGRRADRPVAAAPAPPAPSTPSRHAPEPGRGEGRRGGALDSVLTAGDWDDTRNFSWFLRYRQKATELAGDPARELDLTRSAVIEVSNARGEPVRGASVRILAGNRALLSTITPADGRVFFVPSLDGAGDAKSVTLEVAYAGALSRSERALEGKGAGTWAVKLDPAPYRRASALDVAFVIDTTGSMSDELRYIQREIHHIAANVQSSFQPLDLRFALVLYRDEGDRYVVSSTDFGPLARLEKALLAARADGGGDEPEAVDQALMALGQLSWSQGDVAKVAFLVGDAPSHPQGRTRVLRAGNDARVRGIRLHTVAASDTRPWAELQFRALAQLTLARYVFLTDDSGVGNAHAEPHIPCYQVQKLAGLIERTLRSEVRGWREEVPSDEVIRNVGGPQQGACSYQGLAYRL